MKMSRKKKKYHNKELFRCDCIENKELIRKEWDKYKNKNAILIDVRSKQEYEEGHIDGAISMPYYEIYKRANKELLDKKQKIILYCNTGSRSKRAKQILKKMNYINVEEICKKDK